LPISEKVTTHPNGSIDVELFYPPREGQTQKTLPPKESASVGAAAPTNDVSTTGDPAGELLQDMMAAEEVERREESLSQFLAGGALGVGEGLVPFGGFGHAVGDAFGMSDNKAPEARVGLAVGQIVGGVIATVGGLGGEVLGGAATVTGIGAVVGAVIVLLYCFAGGIRASIWTDAAQSVVMIGAMGVLLWVALRKIGGWAALIQQLHAVSPSYMAWFPPDLAVRGVSGPLLFIAGWVFAGFAVIGQPHIMVRFMAMDHPDHMSRVRLYYYGWFTAFYFLTICAGLAARLLLPETQSFDAELALPTLAHNLLPQALTGLVLAGLFAATMSTADSLILSCTAAITRDFSSQRLWGYMATKLATVFVTALALAIALSRNESVFSLVLIAWSALASAFGPLMIVYALDRKPSEGLAVGMMVAGIAVVLVWRYLGWDESVVYEVMPGMLSGLAVFALGEKIGFSERVRAQGRAH
jgi:Na+/proline symporter